MAFAALSSNDDVGVSVTELTGSEGGGGNIAVQDGWEGFWGINLDTLEDTGAPPAFPKELFLDTRMRTQLRM